MFPVLSFPADSNQNSDLLPLSQICQCIMPDEMSRPLIRGRSEGGSRHLEATMSETGSPVIAILGSGDFSRSLARRLVACGYQVVVGSRTPKRSVALFPEEAEVTHAVILILISSFTI